MLPASPAAAMHTAMCEPAHKACAASSAAHREVQKQNWCAIAQAETAGHTCYVLGVTLCAQVLQGWQLLQGHQHVCSGSEGRRGGGTWLSYPCQCNVASPADRPHLR